MSIWKQTYICIFLSFFIIHDIHMKPKTIFFSQFCIFTANQFNESKQHILLMIGRLVLFLYINQILIHYHIYQQLTFGSKLGILPLKIFGAHSWQNECPQDARVLGEELFAAHTWHLTMMMMFVCVVFAINKNKMFIMMLGCWF